MDYLIINTPHEECLTRYPDFKEPFGRENKIQTQLPRTIALIRTVALAVFAALVSCLAIISPFFWSVVVVQAGFGAWTLYSNLVAKDPLMETFYTIVGEKINLKNYLRLISERRRMRFYLMPLIDWTGRVCHEFAEPMHPMDEMSLL